MNFDDAIKAHMDWKLKLRGYITKTSGDKFDPATVEKDNQCALGKWIYGEGTAFKGDPAYEPLRAAHAEFHKCAAGIIRDCDAGKATEAQIDNGSKFYQLSSDVVGKIVAMRRRCQSAA